MSGRVVDFPIAGTLRPAQALAEAGKVAWSQVVALGLTEDGEFQVINSELTAERALWLLEWGRRWALGLDDDPD
jgi:hypothetical protein